MNDNQSVLWNDSTREKDEALVRFLVQNIVAGKHFEGHYDQCVHKIMNTITTDDWKATYPQRTHIFSVYYAIAIKGVLEVKVSLHAQALELLYFNIANSDQELIFRAGLRFDEKLRIVFKYVYQWEMPQDTADAIRILRNDVMHTGTIAGVEEAYTNAQDPISLERVFEHYEFDANQGHSNIQNRMHLAHLFNLLVQDIVVRTLGLEQADLSMNGAPVWNSNLFGYNHEHRPEWLRVD